MNEPSVTSVGSKLLEFGQPFRPKIDGRSCRGAAPFGIAPYVIVDSCLGGIFLEDMYLRPRSVALFLFLDQWEKTRHAIIHKILGRSVSGWCYCTLSGPSVVASLRPEFFELSVVGDDGINVRKKLA
jgi:hypothetical protein